jgi:hypothetical protein
MQYNCDNYADFVAATKALDPNAMVFYLTVGEATFVYSMVATVSQMLQYNVFTSGDPPPVITDFPTAATLVSTFDVDDEQLLLHTFNDFQAVCNKIAAYAGATIRVCFGYDDEDGHIGAQCFFPMSANVVEYQEAAATAPDATAFLTAFPTATQLSHPLETSVFN